MFMNPEILIRIAQDQAEERVRRTASSLRLRAGGRRRRARTRRQEGER